MARTEVLTNVPKEKVRDMIHDFEAYGATVRTTSEDGGTFRLEAVFEDTGRQSNQSQNQGRRSVP
jgi:hypothetical protein